MDAISRDKRRVYERREPETGLSLTARDFAILLDLYDHRFMNTRQLQTLYGERVFRRLQLLFDHGYLDRPTAQRIWRLREGGGSNPMIYALANRGAKALAARRDIRRNRIDYSERNRELSPFSPTMPHELRIADAYVAFRGACLARGLQLLRAEELARGQNARALDVPGRDAKLYPDWPFAVEGSEWREPDLFLFFLEVDCVTEPNTRRAWEGLQALERKYEGYLSYARAKRPREQFGVGNFRVLTITTGGAAKVEHIAHTAYDVCGGMGVGRFLITNFDTFAQEDPFSLAWTAADGSATSLRR